MATWVVGVVALDGALGVGLAAGSTLLGTLLLYAQYRALAPWWRRRGMTTLVGLANAPTAGYATVTGEAVADASPSITAPFSGDDSLGYAYQIEQHTDGVGWWTVAEGGKSVPFRLEDDTENVRVYPREAAPDVEMVSSEVDIGVALPESVRDRIRASESFDLEERPEYLMGFMGDKRRFGEGSLEAGTDVYVTGKCATKGERGTPEIDARSSPFRVGTGPPPESLGPSAPNPVAVAGGVLLGLLLSLGGAFVLSTGMPAAIETALGLV